MSEQPERRWAVLWLGRWELGELLHLLNTGTPVRLTSGTLPEGAKILDVNYDWHRDAFGVKVEHPSFASVLEGQELPWIPSPMIQVEQPPQADGLVSCPNGCPRPALGVPVIDPGEIRHVPVTPWFHRPVILQAPAGVPLEQLMNVATGTANDLSARGWDVCLPPMVLAGGGPLVGSQRTVNVVLWIRCPADSPLVHEQLAAPPGTHNSKVAAAIEELGMQREAVQV